MRTCSSRPSRFECRLRERRGLLELDHQLVDRNVRAGEISEIPLDAFADFQDRFVRIRSQKNASAARFNVDSHWKRSHREFSELVTRNEPIR